MDLSAARTIARFANTETSPMRMLVLPLVAALAAGPARADDARAFAPDDLVDAAAGDWNRDGLTDLAILAVSDPDDRAIGIYAYLRDEQRGLLRLVLAAPDKVWGSTLKEGFGGQEPSIRALDNGSIAVTMQNFAIGRDRWEETLTLAWRDGRFLVAGYTFDYYDSLQENDPLNCDLNLLTGKGTINAQPATFAPLSITPQDWHNRYGENPGRDICRAG